MCQVPLRAKMRAISTYLGCVGVCIRGAAHGSAPHDFLWVFVLSCQRDFPLVWIPVRFLSL